MREALFDILGGRIEGADFLDLYAGTGAVGIEALSRGARRAVFVERDPRAVELIHRNLAAGGWGAALVIEMDTSRALLDRQRRGDLFSIAFLDPPYGDRSLSRVLGLAIERVRPGGIVVVEHRFRDALAAPARSRLAGGRTYRYGDSALTTLILPDDE